jgi:hypothetical protein
MVELQSNRFEVLRRYLPLRMRAERAKPEKNKMTPKDWLTIGLSSLAFLVSAANVYYNVILLEENLSVVFPFPPMAIRADNDTLSVTSRPANLVFINSGNRSVAITSVEMFYQQDPAETARDQCQEGDVIDRFSMDFEPIVVKGKDVVIQQVQIDDDSNRYTNQIVRVQPGKYSFPVLEENKSKSNFPIQVCLVVHLASPSIYWLISKAGVFEYVVYERSVEIRDLRSPRVLLKKSGTIFGW